MHRLYLTLLLLLPSALFAQECENIGNLLDCSSYNRTMYGSPYYTVHSDKLGSVAQAAIYMPKLLEVIASNCSKQTVRFGCATLFPSCETGYGPCQSLCHVITNDCATEFVEHLQGAFFILREFLQCDEYPTDNCVPALAITPTTSSPLSTTPSIITTPTNAPSTADPNTSNNSLTDDLTGCPPASLNFFTDGAKRFALGWVSTWCTLSFLSTLITILTFMFNPSRFQYPWRPIVFLAVCFNIHSIGYIFAVSLGRKIVTCPGNQFITTSTSWGWEHVPCILVFGILYYSMMAAFLWWLILTLSWCLASSLKWSNEAISNLALFYHLVAWMLPLLMTIAMVASRQLSADELTGICFIVRDDSKSSLYALLFGVIVPLIVFLIIGTIFVVIGLFSVCRIHSFLRHKGQEQESIVLEKLIIRVGVFVSVYMFPAIVLIGCFFYELLQRPNWVSIQDDCANGNCTRANSSVLIVRMFMFMIIGVFTGVWIWSRKSLLSWKEMISNCNGCCGNVKSTSENEEHGSTSMTNMKY